MDREGDGWEGSTYSITKSGSSTALVTGTMSGAAGQDSYQELSRCMDYGTYTVRLTDSGLDPNDIALNIEGCVYLSMYKLSGSFTVAAEGSSNDCNSCSKLAVSLILVGSFYGVPYGWHAPTNFQLTQTSGGSITYQGTLATGVGQIQNFCLDDGTWSLKLDDVPASDDLFDDDDMETYFGTVEYSLDYIDSSGNRESIDATTMLLMNVSNQEAVVSVAPRYGEGEAKGGGGGGSGDDSLSAGIIAAIVIAVVVVIGVASLIAYWASRARSKISSTAFSSYELPSDQ
jgi:hypothetical protein